MSLTRKIASNTAMQVGGKFLGTLLGLFTVAIMTRELGQEGYGEFTTIMSFLQFFGIVVDFGLTLTMVRMISVDGANEDKIASNIFSMRLLAGLIFFGIAPIVALALPYSGAVKLGIGLASLSFLSMTLSQVLVGIFQKHLTAHRAAIAEVAGRVVLLTGVAFAAFSGGGLQMFIVALIAGNLLQFALSFFFAEKHVNIRVQYDTSLWKEIFTQSWPIGLSILFNLIYLKGDIIILSLTRTQAEVGLYGAAYKILDVITAIPMIFMGLALPLLTKAWTANDHGDFSRKLRRSFDFLSLLALPIAFGAFPVADDLMRLLAGDAFASSGIFMAILMLAAAGVFWGALFGHAIVALNLQRKMIWAYAANAVIALVLYTTMIPRMGAIAAAWITVLSEALIALATMIVVLRVSKVKLSLRIFWRALASSFAMMYIVDAASDIHVLPRIALGAVVYAVLLVATKAITKETFGMLKHGD